MFQVGTGRYLAVEDGLAEPAVHPISLAGVFRIEAADLAEKEFGRIGFDGHGVPVVVGRGR